MAAALFHILETALTAAVLVVRSMMAMMLFHILELALTAAILVDQSKVDRAWLFRILKPIFTI